MIALFLYAWWMGQSACASTGPDTFYVQALVPRALVFCVEADNPWEEEHQYAIYVDGKKLPWPGFLTIVREPGWIQASTPAVIPFTAGVHTVNVSLWNGTAESLLGKTITVVALAKPAPVAGGRVVK